VDWPYALAEELKNRLGFRGFVSSDYAAVNDLHEDRAAGRAARLARQSGVCEMTRLWLFSRKSKAALRFCR